MKQLQFKKVNGWGGKRKGAGRPNRTSTVNHMKRPEITGRHPLHITFHLNDEMPGLRRKDLLSAFEDSIRGAREFGLRVIHYSILRKHLHMIVEVDSNEDLALGMRSFGARFGKAVRKIAKGSGSVFKGRYHLHVLKTPAEMRNALEYVLLNRAKHRQMVEHFDPFSSAYGFKEWRELLGPRFRGLIKEEIESLEKMDLGLSAPRTWLARMGWKKAR